MNIAGPNYFQANDYSKERDEFIVKFIYITAGIFTSIKLKIASIKRDTIE